MTDLAPYWKHLEKGFPFKKNDLANIDEEIFSRMCVLESTPTVAPQRIAGTVPTWILEKPAYDNGIPILTDLVGDTEQLRLSAVVDGAESAFTIWKNEIAKAKDQRPALARIVRHAAAMKEGTINHRLREAFYMMFKEASTFGCWPVRMIIKHTSATRILDPCAGWGDRLIGALSCNEVTRYTGIDPHLAMQRSYSYMIDNYGRARDFKVICGPAESMLRTLRAPYDLVFTSPPFYRKEIYDDGPFQSSKYATFEEWKRRFLFTVFSLSWNLLEAGGWFIIHIDDIRRSDNPFIIVADMIKYMNDLPGCVFEGKIVLSGRMKMPCWCFRKKI